MFTPISVLMQERGMSKGELTSRTGLNNSTVWSVLKARHRPQKDTLSAIAKALDITVEEVLESLEAEWQLQAAKKLEAVDGIVCRVRESQMPLLPDLRRKLRHLYWEFKQLEKSRPACLEEQQPPKLMNEPAANGATKQQQSGPSEKQQHSGPSEKQQHSGPPAKRHMFLLKRRKSRKPQTSCSKAIA